MHAMDFNDCTATVTFTENNVVGTATTRLLCINKISNYVEIYEFYYNGKKYLLFCKFPEGKVLLHIMEY